MFREYKHTIQYVDTFVLAYNSMCGYFCIRLKGLSC